MPITTFKLKRGTASQWTAVNPTLADGEPGFEKDTNRFKIGNGITPWTDLDYFFSSSALLSMLSPYFAAKSVETTVNSGRLSASSLLSLISARILAESPVITTDALEGDVPVWSETLSRFVPGAFTGGGGTTIVKPVPIRFSADTPTTGPTGTDRASYIRTVTGARMRTGSAPSGSDLVAEVQHWNGATWTTIATLTIAAGTTTEAVSSTLSQVQNIGNMLRLNVVSVGSGTPAQDVVVDVDVEVSS